MTVYLAANLRDIDKSADRHWLLPGWYQWWAPYELSRELLGEFSESILPGLTQGRNDLEGFHLMYIGITKETLFSRVVKWHICEKHDIGKCKHRTLSTFRQSISSLASGNWADESSTNAVIDRMKIEVFPVEMTVGALKTKHHLESLEDKQIERHLVPLNIRGNNDPRLANFHRYLQERRRQGRALALQELAIENPEPT